MAADTAATAVGVAGQHTSRSPVSEAPLFSNSLPEARTQILLAWSGGPGVIVLTGPPGSGKTKLLDQLAASFRQTGRIVHVAGRGDCAVIPAGAAILLIDEVGRMPNPLLRRLFDSTHLFCVVADRPAIVDRLRSIGIAAPIIRIGGNVVACWRPPSRPWLSRGIVGIGAGVLATVVAAVVLLQWPGPSQPRASRPSLAAATPGAPPVAARPPSPALPAVAPPPPTPATPLPVEPAPALVSVDPVRAASESGAIAADGTAAPLGLPAVAPTAAPSPSPEAATARSPLPSGAIPRLSLRYATGDGAAALLAKEATARLREAGFAAQDPVASAHSERPAIRYHFEQDRNGAESIRSHLTSLFADLPIEQVPAGVDDRPGQIEISLSRSQGGPAEPDYETIVRARRVSVHDAEPRVH